MKPHNNRGTVTIISNQTMSEAVLDALRDKLTDLLTERRHEVDALHASGEPYSYLTSAWLEPQDPDIAETTPPCFITIMFGNSWKPRLVYRIAHNLMRAETEDEIVAAIQDALDSLAHDSDASPP